MRITPENILMEITKNPVNFAIRTVLLRGLNSDFPEVPLPWLPNLYQDSTLKIVENNSNSDRGFPKFVATASGSYVLPLLLWFRTIRRVVPEIPKIAVDTELGELLQDSVSLTVVGLVNKNLSILTENLNGVFPSDTVRKAVLRLSLQNPLFSSSRITENGSDPMLGPVSVLLAPTELLPSLSERIVSLYFNGEIILDKHSSMNFI